MPLKLFGHFQTHCLHSGSRTQLAQPPQVQIEQVSGGPGIAAVSAWGGMPVPLVWGPCFETLS